MVYLMGFVIRNLEGKFRVYKNKKASTIIRLSMLFTGRGDWIRTSDHTPPRGLFYDMYILYLFDFQYGFY